MISASHEDKAITGCFFEPQLMVAPMYWKTIPEVEWRTAQSASLMPNSGSAETSYRSPGDGMDGEDGKGMEGS